MCQIDGCGKTFNKFKSLLNHLHTVHAVAKVDTHGHWLHEAALRERRGGDDKTLGGLEVDHVSLVYKESGEVDENYFKCQICNKRLHKKSCKHHMVAMHHLHPSEVVTWLTYLDGEKLRKVTKDSSDPVSADRLYLTGAMLRHIAAIASTDGCGADDQPATSTFLQPTSKQAAKPPAAANPLPVAAQDPDVQVPLVSITQESICGSFTIAIATIRETNQSVGTRLRHNKFQARVHCSSWAPFGNVHWFHG